MSAAPPTATGALIAELTHPIGNVPMGINPKVNM
jgi:hypothetical protein